MQRRNKENEDGKKEESNEILQIWKRSKQSKSHILKNSGVYLNQTAYESSNLCAFTHKMCI